MPHTDQPVYRVPSDGKSYGSVEADFDALFDLDQDPDCQTNLYHTNQTRRGESLQSLIHTMREHQVPEEQFERLGLKD